MSRMSLNAFSLFVAVLISPGLWTSCYGGVAVAELPNPADDDRPPGSPPELPRAYVEFPPATLKGHVRTLVQGDDLQDAIDAAAAGDIIALQPGAAFKGPLTLPKTSGDAWVTIRTSAADNAFPPAGTRVNPSHAPLMPIIEIGRAHV